MTAVFGLLFAGCGRPVGDRDVDLVWERLSISGPSARFDAAMAVDFGNQRAFLFGGRSTEGCLADLWVYRGDRQAWERVTLGQDESGPAPRSGASLVYDADRRSLVLFGGFCYDSTGETHYFQDIWVIDFKTNWRQEFVSKGPASRAWHAAAIHGDDMLIMGGYARDDRSPRGHVFRGDSGLLNLKSFDYRQLVQDRGPRMTGRPGLLADKDGSRFVVVGRDGVLKPQRVGRWSIDSASGSEWKRDDAGGKPPSVDYQIVVADPNLMRFTVLEGPDDWRTGWRVWQSQAFEGGWRKRKVSTGPSTPVGMNCAPDPVHPEALLCHGGAFRDRIGSDTWRLKPSSAMERS